MKGNNSLTCAKTVQKQPFLMSDTSCPRDAFYVSNSLIKQHPRRARPGTRETQACASVRARVCNFFGVWIVRCDLGALIFTQQGSITPVVVLFIVFFSSSSSLTIRPFFSLSKEVGSFFFFLPGCFSFCQRLNIKRVKSKKWNSLQWGVLPAKEWGGVRIQNDSRCALLNRILLCFFFFLRLPWNVIGGSLHFASFVPYFLSNSQTGSLHCGSFDRKHKRTSPQICLSVCSFNIRRLAFLVQVFWGGRIKHVRVTLKHLNGNLRLPFVSTSTPRACLLVPARSAVVFGLCRRPY